MRKYFQVGGLVFCLGLFGGCGPEVADPADSEFTGDDLEASDAANAGIGFEEEGGDPGGEPGGDPGADPAAPAE